MENKDLYVVGIGASAGGLDAIQQLFGNLLNDTGMTFVIIQHLSPDYKSLMPELLAKHTRMKIYTAENNQIIKPNCIYLNPKSKNLLINGNKLFLADKSPRPNLNLPIDIFFHTLGEAHKDKSIGVILSGTGSDGSRGIKTIKEAGGTIIVQDPESAQFDGMPNSAINTDLVDYILIPSRIAETIIKTRSNRIQLSPEEEKVKANDIIFSKILDEIHRISNLDFKQYKKNTLLRRLEKRMNINNIEKLYDYYTYAKSNKKELESLKRDFLIGVTSFFRDEEAFEIIKDVVIPEICNKKRKNGESVRVWVAGCSTGEEVFTLAILFDDYIKMRRLNLDFKVFATDVDEVALEKAGLAKFTHNNVNGVLKQYIDTYFVKRSTLNVIKRIRERIVFSQHNLLKDPPFIKMDLISCRNMLIYLENKAQRKVLMNFQFSLNANGYLLLGSSESLGQQARFFKIINSKWKIYQNISEAKRLPLQDSIPLHPEYLRAINPKTNKVEKLKYRPKENPENIFYRYIGQEFGPAMVFVDADFNILFVNGDITSRLSVKGGIFERNLLKFVNMDMVPLIRNGIRKAEKENKDIIIKDVKNKVGDNEFWFDLGFRKIQNIGNVATDLHEENKVFVVYFSKDKILDEKNIEILEQRGTRDLRQQQSEIMETELKETRAELQNVVEELETSNEELQSSNEELMASNEELQSTNEELQSVNEELYTVNAELQEKNKELFSLNNDINNLLNSTEIGTLFLDVDLRIRKFTPALKKHFNLQEEDIGRTISSFASSFNGDDRKSIITDCEFTLEKFTSIEAEVWDEFGNCYLRKTSPFITTEKKIEGVVISFVDISRNKKVEEELIQSEKRYRKLFNNHLHSIAVYEVVYNEDGDAADLRYIDGNDKLEEAMHTSRKDFIGKTVSKIIPGFTEKYKELFDRYVRVAETGKGEQFEFYYEYFNAYYDIKIFSYKRGVVATIKEDITKKRKLGHKLKENEKRLKKEEKFTERILETSPNGIYIYDILTRTKTFTNQRSSDILGYSKERLIAMTHSEYRELFHPDDIDTFEKHINEVASGVRCKTVEYRFKHKDGHWIWCYSIDTPFEEDENGRVLSCIGSFIDLSDKKAFEEALKVAKRKAEVANIYKNQFLANMSHEIRTPLNGIVGFAELLKNTDRPDEKARYAEIIKNNSNQLLLLINDIIDVSKIEAGELKLSRRPCLVTKMINDLEITFNELKQQKDKENIELVSKTPAEHSGLLIETDPFRLQQVLSNLISNALKFSEKGKIEFGYEVYGHIIRFFVSDQGVGIPKEHLQLICNRFEQLQNVDPGKNEGTGLGLSISKGIIDLLNGRLYIESEENKGSTFSFELPLNKLNGKELNPVSHEDEKRKELLKEITILIAEDEPVNIEYLRIIMSDYPCSVIYAKNGKEAVQYYFQNNIDIVLMDIKMPIMDGETAAVEILAKDPNAKIFAQTAYAMESDGDKFRELGFIEHIPKPIDKKDLFKKITHHINRT